MSGLDSLLSMSALNRREASRLASARKPPMRVFYCPLTFSATVAPDLRQIRMPEG